MVPEVGAVLLVLPPSPSLREGGAGRAETRRGAAATEERQSDDEQCA